MYTCIYIYIYVYTYAYTYVYVYVYSLLAYYMLYSSLISARARWRDCMGASTRRPMCTGMQHDSMPVLSQASREGGWEALS